MLLTLSFFVFTLDLSQTYVGITAPLYNGNTNNKNISFIFVIDKNTNTTVLPQIIDTLKNARAHSTFFVSGSWVAGNIELTKTLSADFELGNYGFTNAKLNINDSNKIKGEILYCHDIVKSVAGVEMNLFMPPDMEYNKTTLSAAESLGYRTILPTRNADINKPKAGDLILMYITKSNAETLSKTIANLLAQNFHIVSVGSNII
jgi:peptidoglycan/xylan/chitin deacetylase (PgdA/CDA1 family)